MMKNVEIIFKESRCEKYMLQFEDINGKSVGICLMSVGYVRIDKKTNELSVANRDWLPTVTVKDRIYVYIDLALFGRVYTVSVANVGDYIYIKCNMK